MPLSVNDQKNTQRTLLNCTKDSAAPARVFARNLVEKENLHARNTPNQFLRSTHLRVVRNRERRGVRPLSPLPEDRLLYEFIGEYANSPMVTAPTIYSLDIYPASQG